MNNTFRAQNNLAKLTSILFALIIICTSMLANPIIVFADNTTDTTYEWPAAPEISAGSAILIDADTGAILYDKDSHTMAYPASITKILTGLLTVENCSLDEVVTFSSEAANSVKWDESNIGTKTGEQYTVEQALYALLLHSANEVAYGLAEHISGSLGAFTDMMNSRAKELGALNTHFSNASGLSDTNHYTTAYDLAMIGRGCYNNSTFVAFDSYSSTYKLGPTNLTSTIRNIVPRHQMLKGKPHYYEYFKGGKTGYTDESGHTLITFAEKDDMRLICVVLKESNDSSRYIDTRTLFDYGFSNFNKTMISKSDISSLFDSSNYYNSRVYGNASIDFSLDASYLNLPTSASLSDVTLTVSDVAAGNEDNSGYTALMTFNYGSHTVGTANLIVTGSNSTNNTSRLPYLTSTEDEIPGASKCFVINIWYLAIGSGLILIILWIYSNIKHSRELKRRRNYRRRKLKY